VTDALWVLRRILAFARANGLFPPGFDPTDGLDAPIADKVDRRRPGRSAQPRPLTLPECARLASHLHPVHQLAFWLQRIMGLRISEAFGVGVSDIVDLGGTGLLAVQGQGGRSFSVRDDHGQVVAVPYKQTTKTSAGSRVLVVPEQLMDLVRVAIDAFHTDPDTGQVNAAARLVPGLQTPDRSGRTPTVTPSRKPLLPNSSRATTSASPSPPTCSERAAPLTSPGPPASRTPCGAASWDTAPATTSSGASTPSTTPTSPPRKVAEILDHNIAMTIGTLTVPTIRHAQWGSANPPI